MSPLRGLAVAGHNVGDARGPCKVFRGVRIGGNVGVRRKPGHVGRVFVIQNIVGYVDLENCRRRDLRQSR